VLVEGWWCFTTNWSLPHFWVLVWVVFHTNQFEGVEFMKPCKVLTSLEGNWLVVSDIF